MDRRRALAISAATAATTLGAVAAIAANFGLLGFGEAPSSQLGKLGAGGLSRSTAEPTAVSSGPAAAPNVTVRYEDIYIPAPATPAALATGRSVEPPVTAATDLAPAVTDPAAAPAAATDAVEDGAIGDGLEPTNEAEHEAGEDREDRDGEHEEDD